MALEKSLITVRIMRKYKIKMTRLWPKLSWILRNIILSWKILKIAIQVWYDLKILHSTSNLDKNTWLQFQKRTLLLLWKKLPMLKLGKLVFRGKWDHTKPKLLVSRKGNYWLWKWWVCKVFDKNGENYHNFRKIF